MKKPADSALIKKVIDTYGNEGASLKDLRLAALCCFDFAGFFRFSKLVNIQPSHLTCHDEFIKVFVPGSKTDVYREGNYVYISKSQSNYCPVSILRRYVDAASLDLASCEGRKIVLHLSPPQRLRCGENPLSEVSAGAKKWRQRRREQVPALWISRLLRLHSPCPVDPHRKPS